MAYWPEGCETWYDEAPSIMPLSRTDLADYSYFLAIARHRSFRRAGLDLGVSASALSHALKGLETRVGIRLLNRTNRSVTLTAAGEELLAAISRPFDDIEQAVDRLNRYRDTPTGRIRINIPVEAATLLIGPILREFVDRYPDVELDVAVSNHLVDVTEGGFDAGIRYGGTVPTDMVAQRLSADIRWVVAGSPAYFDRYGTADHPDDLAAHRCLRFRIGDDSIYKWEFERAGEEIAVDVPGSLIFDDSRAILAALVGGVGLMYAPEPLIAPLVANGSVRLILEDWAPVGSGFYAYYSSRRQLPTGLRLLIALIREMRPLGL
jgi:DNA-binding transcriptional LysR family regulator